jgi:hypothetical protein
MALLRVGVPNLVENLFRRERDGIPCVLWS